MNATDEPGSPTTRRTALDGRDRVDGDAIPPLAAPVTGVAAPILAPDPGSPTTRRTALDGRDRVDGDSGGRAASAPTVPNVDFIPAVANVKGDAGPTCDQSRSQA